MKKYGSIACMFLMAISFGRAQVALPDLTIKEGGRKKSLELRALSIDVRLEGLLAETVLEMEFFNHSGMNQEGEFVLQLPTGATVSTYALEINGRMRPGVAVEKDKARNAYESIKRRQIDPGLVEREEGNIYRTRIFPIEHDKTKRVRIGFIQSLPDSGEYVFPLNRDEIVKNFSCVVHGTDDVPKLVSEGLPATPRETQLGSWKWEGEHVGLDGALRAKSKLPKPGQPLVRIGRQPDGAAHFLVQGKVVEPAIIGEEEWHRKWKKIRLIWDASYSRRWQKHEAEFAALRKIWEWQGECEVNLQVLNNSLGEARKFHITKGKEVGKELGNILREISYDGAADFSQIEPWDGVTLLMTDGRISSPIWALGKKNTDFYIITSGADRLDSGLVGLTTKWIDLHSAKWWDRLTRVPLNVEVEGREDEGFDLVSNGNFYAASGRIRADFEGNFTVRLDRKGVIVSTPISLLSEDREEWNFSRRVWAQRRLRSLELEGDRGRITAFAKAERLASDFTSLIVLERFDDHVRYRIPPPEPELLARYKLAIGSKENITHNALRAWDRKNHWHHSDFAWVDGELEEEIEAVSIWVKASNAAFPEEKRNKDALEPYVKWLPLARELPAAKDGLKTGAELEKWWSQVRQRVKDLKEIRDKPVVLAPGKQVYVSVRGFVAERGIYAGKIPFPVDEAIEKAGGPNHYGSWEEVYLYRGAQRTGYNLLNMRFTKVNLQWGDMVVVEGSYRHAPTFLSGGGPFADPFAAPFADPRGSAGAARGDGVFEQPGDIRIHRPRGADPPFASSSATEPSGIGYNGEPSLAGSFSAVSPVRQATSKNQLVVKTLRDHPQPATKYAELLQGEFGKDGVSMLVVIEIARLLFERNEVDLAERVLSNLCELEPNPVEATRSYAYWLAELGKPERAIEILTALAAVVADEASRALVFYDLGQITGKVDFFRKSVEAELAQDRPGSLGAIVLTDYFGNGGEADGELAIFQKNPLSSDVRIVITTVGGHATLQVDKPNGFDLDIDYGGQMLESDRVQEYQMRRALPGSYKVAVARWEENPVPITVQANFYIRWASGQQEKRTRTLLMKGQKLELDDLVFDWAE